MNTGQHVSSWIMVFSGYMPSSRIAGSMVVLQVTSLNMVCLTVMKFTVENSDLELSYLKIRTICQPSLEGWLLNSRMSSREPTSLENFNSPQMSICLKDFASILSKSAGHILLRINLMILDYRFSLTNGPEFYTKA